MHIGRPRAAALNGGKHNGAMAYKFLYKSESIVLKSEIQTLIANTSFLQDELSHHGEILYF